MNGGKIVIKNTSHYAQSSETTLVGNTCLYGATGGEIYVAGSAGERFAVRNSGANIYNRGSWRSLLRIHDRWSCNSS